MLLSLVLVIYGAAIHPLSQNIERQEAGAAVLAEAVKVSDLKIVQTQIDIARLKDHQESVIDQVKDINANGTEKSDKRISLIEQQLQAVKSGRTTP